jgi:transcriptional regulator with GAF, ATPase, and Fis domain
VTDKAHDYSTHSAWNSETFIDLLADVSDVFTDDIDSDGSMALLQACLEVTDSSIGTLYLDDSAGRLESVATTADVEAIQDSAPSDLATKALVSRRLIVTQGPRSAASLAVPLRSRRRVIGIVEIQMPPGRPPADHTLSALQSVADVAAATIDHVRTIHDAARLLGQLQSALEHRVVIEQAKGVVAERLGVDCHSAFTQIRHTARQEQRPISDVATDIVASRGNGFPKI